MQPYDNISNFWRLAHVSDTGEATFHWTAWHSGPDWDSSRRRPSHHLSRAKGWKGRSKNIPMAGEEKLGGKCSPRRKSIKTKSSERNWRVFRIAFQSGRGWKDIRRSQRAQNTHQHLWVSLILQHHHILKWNFPVPPPQLAVLYTRLQQQQRGRWQNQPLKLAARKTGVITQTKSLPRNKALLLFGKKQWQLRNSTSYLDTYYNIPFLKSYIFDKKCKGQRISLRPSA